MKRYQHHCLMHLLTHYSYCHLQDIYSILERKILCRKVVCCVYNTYCTTHTHVTSGKLSYIIIYPCLFTVFTYKRYIRWWYNKMFIIIAFLNKNNYSCFIRLVNWIYCCLNCLICRNTINFIAICSFIWGINYLIIVSKIYIIKCFPCYIAIFICYK